MLPFFTLCREGHLLYFFEYNFFVKPSVCELLLWLLMSVSGWCMTMSRFFICVMPGKVLANGADTLYYGKNKPCRYNDYFLILIWWWLIFCYLLGTKVRIKSDKQKNVAKLLADRRFRKMAWKNERQKKQWKSQVRTSQRYQFVTMPKTGYDEVGRI